MSFVCRAKGGGGINKKKNLGQKLKSKRVGKARRQKMKGRK